MFGPIYVVYEKHVKKMDAEQKVVGIFHRLQHHNKFRVLDVYKIEDWSSADKKLYKSALTSQGNDVKKYRLNYKDRLQINNRLPNIKNILTLFEVELQLKSKVTFNGEIFRYNSVKKTSFKNLITPSLIQQSIEFVANNNDIFLDDIKLFLEIKNVTNFKGEYKGPYFSSDKQCVICYKDVNSIGQPLCGWAYLFKEESIELWMMNGEPLGFYYVFKHNQVQKLQRVHLESSEGQAADQEDQYEVKRNWNQVWVEQNN